MISTFYMYDFSISSYCNINLAWLFWVIRVWDFIIPYHICVVLNQDIINSLNLQLKFFRC